jgi:hypothetical protein
MGERSDTRKHLNEDRDPLRQSYRYVCPNGGGLELRGGTNYSMQCELRVKSFLWVLQMLGHYIMLGVLLYKAPGLRGDRRSPNRAAAHIPAFFSRRTNSRRSEGFSTASVASMSHACF